MSQQEAEETELNVQCTTLEHEKEKKYLSTVIPKLWVRIPLVGRSLIFGGSPKEIQA